MVKILSRYGKKFVIEVTEQELEDFEDMDFDNYVKLPPLDKKGAEELAKQLQNG